MNQHPSSDAPLAVIVLAAGQGTRMKSPLTIRGGSGVSDCSVSNWTPRPRTVEAGFMAPGGAALDSSTRTFHSPQAEHCPAHLE